MYNNYPDGANMSAYYHQQDLNDQINAENEDAAEEALNSVESQATDNLAIIYDETDGVTSNGLIMPYPTFYDTNSPDFWKRLDEDLREENIDEDQIQQLHQDAKTYEVSDCLEKLLPDAEIMIGQNRIDIDNQYFDRYVYWKERKICYVESNVHHHVYKEE